MEKRWDVVEFPLSVLQKIGLISRTKSAKTIVLQALFILYAALWVFVCLMQFSRIKGNIAEFALNSEALGVMGQVLLKIMTTVHQQSNLFKLVDYTEPFWETNKCSTEVKLQLDSILTNILRLQQMFFCCMILSCVFADTSVLFGKPLPLGIWKMDEYQSLYRLVLGFQLVLPLMAVFMGAFDSLFVAFCAKAVVQFRILCHCFRELRVFSGRETIQRQYQDELKQYIQYHAFLLRFIKDFQNIYSTTLLVQYGTSATCICIDLYALLENKDLPTQVRQGTIILTQIFQLALYCIAADCVAGEAMEVGNAIYQSKWYFQQTISTRSILTIAIQKSQQEIDFKGGGTIDINSRAIITVIKASWSICTVMRGLQKND